jgi:hypothetical protein
MLSPEELASIRGRAASSPIRTSNTALDDSYLAGRGFRSAMVNSAMTIAEEFVMVMVMMMMMMTMLLWYQNAEMRTRARAMRRL